MADVRSIYPAAVTIPDDVPLSRIVRPQANGAEVTLPDTELRNYDYRTVFYDVIFCPAEGRLFALAPPFLNLEKDLLPVRATISGTTLDYSIVRRDLLWIFEFHIEHSLATTVPTVTFEFGPFSTTVVANVRDHRTTPFQMTLTTLQRDNPADWVLDWCAWHHALYGVDHLLLYDNGSVQASTLKQRLAECGLPITISFVHWPFPYGPASTPSLHGFSHMATLNHMRMMFGHQTAWCMVLDVDEYLVFRSIDRFSAWQEQLTRQNVCLVILDSYMVPDAPPIDTNRRHKRVTDFRLRSSRPRRANLKYLCRPARMAHCDVHHALPTSPFRKWLARKVFYSIPRRLARFPFVRDRLPFSRIPVRAFDPQMISYFHFMGLNTGWKDDASDQVVNTRRWTGAVEPDSVIQDLAGRFEFPHCQDAD